MPGFPASWPDISAGADRCGCIARPSGWDLLRAPLNVLLVGPTLFLRLTGLACRWLGWRRLGTWLARRNLFVETNLARRMADLVLSDLLRLDDAPSRLARRHAERGSVS